MRRFKLNRKAAAVGVVVGLALAVGGVAFAYVTATGSGTGYGKVGTKSTVTGKLTVSVTSCITPTKLLPGETQSCTYKVHNPTGGQVKFTTNTIALATTNTPTVTGTAGKVTGCKLIWFTVTIATQAVPTTLAAGGTATGVVHLKWNTTATPQTTCLGAKPKFTITVPA